MIQEALRHFPWPWLSVSALFIFLVFFLGVLIRVNLRHQRHLFEHAAGLPLEELEVFSTAHASTNQQSKTGGAST